MPDLYEKISPSIHYNHFRKCFNGRWQVLWFCILLFLLSGLIQTSLQASQPSCTEGKYIVDYAIKYVGTNKYVRTMGRN